MSRERATNMQLKEDGTAYIHSWHGDDDGRYEIEEPNKIIVYSHSYYNGNEIRQEFFFDGENLILDTGEEKISYIHKDKLMTAEDIKAENISSQSTDDISNVYEPSYYNAEKEIKQIRSYNEQGLYLEAMQLCEDLKKQHILSDVDISIIDSFYDMAEENYKQYLNEEYLKNIQIGALNFAQMLFNEIFEVHTLPSFWDPENVYLQSLYWPNNNWACTIEYHPDEHKYYVWTFCEELMDKTLK